MADDHPEADAPLPRLLGLAGRRLADELHGRLRAAGFDDGRPAHDAVFANVPPEGIRLTDLAQRAGMTKQAMSELVVDLERLGYVTRRRHPVDGRARLITFTERGWASVATALDAFRAIEAELGERVGADRLGELRGTLLDILGPPDAG
jgi:DNA-binding MarR family transcriptional regulator